MNENPLSYGVLNDLRRALPYIGGLLSKTAVQVKASDLSVINAEYLPRRYMADEACRDVEVARYGLGENSIPFVLTQRPDEEEGVKIPGWGIVIYETQDRKLRYAVYCCPDSDNWGNDFRGYVVRKSEAKSLRDHIREQDAKANRITRAPILKPGQLEQILESSIGFLLRRKKIEEFGVRIVRGILLEGDPGNGKSMVCKWIRKLCIDHDWTWQNVASGTIKSWHSNGSNLHDLFNQSTVTFFDDFDFELVNGDSGRDIISALDGLEDTNHRIRIFTTNQNLRNVDEAFFRPGRMDARFRFEKPDAEMRRRLVDQVWPKEISEYINEPGRMKVFLAKSSDFSFADLEAVRSQLVFFYDVEGVWNQDEAFRRFQSLRAKQARRTMGFGA